MAITFPKVPHSLTPYVNRLIISEDFNHDPLHVRPWATGATYLVYFYNHLSNYEVIVEGKHHNLIYPAWMAGQLKYHQVDLNMKRDTQVVVAELKPQAFWQLFHRAGETLTGRTCQMRDLHSDIETLSNLHFLPVAETKEQALAAIIGFLEALVPNAQPADLIVDYMLTNINKNPEKFDISYISKKQGISRQTLTKRFTKIVGLGPKFYSRVIQVNRLVDLLIGGKKIRLAFLALRAGFYDQAHMTKAMHQFFSQGPNEFLQSDHETFLEFLQKLRDDVVD